MSNKAAKYDLTIDRATEYDFVLTIQSPLGTAVNIGSANFYSDIRNAYTKQPILSFTTTILDSGVNGQVKLALTEANTLTLSPSVKYEYDLFMQRSGVMERLLYGQITVRDNITTGVPVDPIS